MRRTAFVALALLMMAATMSTPASAITNGQADGNLHPNVGAIVADWSPGSPGPEITCSGTLVGDRVFLTVAHCIQFVLGEGLDIRVTFDPVYDESADAPGGLISGVAISHPQFGSTANADPNDIAVVLLDRAPGIAPAQVPVAGLLDALHADQSLAGATVTAVGFGETRSSKTGGWHALVPRDGTRRYATQHVRALRPHWLTLSSNASNADGGSCNGDSGGPHFLGGIHSNLVVSITVDADSTCRAIDHTYRLDTEEARDFLAAFITVP